VERCVDELIPMLTELIDRIDNNTELLMHLAIQLGTLTSVLGEERCIHLTTPLQLIAAADDNVVRQKAIESLLKVGDTVNDETLEAEFVDLIEKLAKGDLYSMRISAASLFSQTYRRASETTKAKLS
jgi:serine/threonine-protein phosphatase 2A regulatory subunit A